jgi:hypothetical protein
VRSIFFLELGLLTGDSLLRGIDNSLKREALLIESFLEDDRLWNGAEPLKALTGLLD